MEFKSHPNKELKQHAIGVLKKFKYDSWVSYLLSFGHDIGKITKEFQDRMNGVSIGSDVYSNHSYLSAFFIIKVMMDENNQAKIIDRFNVPPEDYKLYVIIVANIISHHHGNLQNIDNVFNNQDELNRMINYLTHNNANMCNSINLYLSSIKESMGVDLFIDNKGDIEYYIRCANINTNIQKWSQNSLNFYLLTTVLFSNLIHADRRDASDNEYCYRNEKTIESNYALGNNLGMLLDNFNQNTELNKVRTIIREKSISNIKNHLHSNNRIFTLTSPTGSGKTLMMLSLANEINRKFNNKYGIIYTLPFLSIIDQTKSIVNKSLLIRTLNYTSTSDSSILKHFDIIEKKGLNDDISKYLMSELSFDHPFVITTFNQLFESILTNNNKRSIKVSNFNKRIFLIDEFQSLEPSLYYFMMRLLKGFCDMNDCYAIISTATMPKFDIDLNKHTNIKKLFGDFFKPVELLDKSVFNYRVFNRYDVCSVGECDEHSLVDMLSQETKSTLVIMNTIKSSKILFDLMHDSSNYSEVILLNSHISPSDRISKILKIKELLESNTKILVISTQLIEAGVDISFPVVYRDLAPIPNLVQSFGRCNRNGEYGVGYGKIFLFKRADSERYDSDMVYSYISSKFTNDVKNFSVNLNETEFLQKTEGYFYSISKNTKHGDTNKKDLAELILFGRFNDIGDFKLIHDEEKCTLYVGDDDTVWSEYVSACNAIGKCTNYNIKSEYEQRLKEWRTKIIKNSINVKDEVIQKVGLTPNDCVFGIYRLIDMSYYNYYEGLVL